MWRDRVNILLGFGLAASPWVIGGPEHLENAAIVWNGLLTGGGLAIFVGWAAASPQEVCHEWVVVLLGVRMLTAPGTLDYDIP